MDFYAGIFIEVNNEKNLFLSRLVKDLAPFKCFTDATFDTLRDKHALLSN